MSAYVADLPDPRTQPTITVEATAALLCVGPQTAYRAIRRGEIPSIRVGRLIRVPTARLLAMLGQQTPPTEQAPPDAAGDALASS